MALSQERYRSLSRYLEEHFRPGDEPSRHAPAAKAESEILRQSLASDISFGVAKELTKDKKSSKPVAGRGPERSSRTLADVVAHPEETFSRALFRLIRERDADEVAVYKKAGIDRKHFSKIRSNDDYCPKKPTVLALAISLELNLDETLDLLGRAGFTLSRSSRTDLIVEYFIDEGIWDFFEINEALAAFEQPLLNAG